MSTSTIFTVILIAASLHGLSFVIQLFLFPWSLLFHLVSLGAIPIMKFSWNPFKIFSK